MRLFETGNISIALEGQLGVAIVHNQVVASVPLQPEVDGSDGYLCEEVLHWAQEQIQAVGGKDAPIFSVPADRSRRTEIAMIAAPVLSAVPCDQRDDQAIERKLLNCIQSELGYTNEQVSPGTRLGDLPRGWPPADAFTLEGCMKREFRVPLESLNIGRNDTVAQAATQLVDALGLYPVSLPACTCARCAG